MHFDPLELSIERKLTAVVAIDEVVRGVATQMGFSEAAAADIELAIHEAIVNAIVHGDAPIALRLAREADALVAEVRDGGPGFDPARVPSPLDDDRRLVPSGRGIFAMRTFMDEVDYLDHPPGGTLVRMTKRLPPRGGPAAQTEEG